MMKHLFGLLTFLLCALPAGAQFPDHTNYVVSSGGSANAQTLAVPNYVGPVVLGLMTFSNTGPMTLAVNGTGVIAVKKRSGGSLAALTGGEVVAGQIAEFLSDGTQYELLSNGGTSSATAINIVSDCGADPTNTADSTVAIQACIDRAAIQPKQAVLCPDGNYKTSLPIYVDYPNNLRGIAAPKPATTAIKAAASTGALILLGDQSGNIYTTPDGVTISAAIPIAGAGAIAGIAFGGTKAIAVDGAGKAFVASSPFTSWAAGVSISANPLTSVVFVSGTTFIASDNAGNVYVSTNAGTSWGSATLLASGGSIISLAFGLGDVVAADAVGNVYVSANSGSTWGAANPVFSGTATVLAFNNTGFVVGTSIGTAYHTTTPASSWSGPVTATTGGASMTALWGGGSFIMGDANGVYYESANSGATWNAVTIKIAVSPITAVVFLGGHHVAATSTGIVYTSTDDIVFSITPFDPTVTYPTSFLVSYNGIPWASLSNSNVGNTPTTASNNNWTPTSVGSAFGGFSITFSGSLDGLGSYQNGHGCVLHPTFNNSFALASGTGRGMSIKGVQIAGPNNGYRGNLNTFGIGIAVMGDASNTLIENDEVDNFYNAYETGSNQNNLADSNTFQKVIATNCYNGILINGTQNDINSVTDPTLSCTNNLVTISGPGMHVWGGNPSAVSGQGNSFGISGTSSLTAVASGSGFKYSFTTVIASPDIYIPNVYNSFMIVTPNFGVIPLILTNWNSGTNTATFQMSTSWGLANFIDVNAATTTALGTDVSAATTLYATERLTVFKGQGIVATGQHIENPSACTTLADSNQGFTGDAGIELDHLRFNYDPGNSIYAPSLSPTPTQLAYFYCQQVFGFIINAADGHMITLRDNVFTQTFGSAPVLIDWLANDGVAKLNASGNELTMYAPNVRITGAYRNNGVGGPFNPANGGYYYPGVGVGNWDQNPFLPNLNNADTKWRSASAFSSPSLGYFPSPWSMPRTTPTELAILAGTLPTTLGSYPILNGGTVYSVVDWNSGALTNLFARSAHQFYSYGQNLTTTNIPGLSWSYKGQSFVVNLDASTLAFMQEGLGLTLNNGSGAVHYIVTGVYQQLGYITVMNATSNVFTAPLLAGTSTTTYTGTTIGQDSYSITNYP